MPSKSKSSANRINSSPKGATVSDSASSLAAIDLICHTGNGYWAFTLEIMFWQDILI
jgi:hypothetical protein